MNPPVSGPSPATSNRGESANGGHLLRTLGLRSAVMMVVGNVVGAGIFTTSGFLAQEVTNPLLFLGAWALGGVLTLLGASVYAELGAMFPRAGGDYQYLKEAYGPAAGFVVGWISFCIITPGSIAALSLAFSDYLPVGQIGEMGKTGVAVATIVAITGVNLRGVKIAGGTQDLVTIGSLVLLVGLVVAGFASGSGDLENFRAQPPAADGVAFAGTALISVVFTYSGWFASAYIGSEIVDPGRNVPRSLLFGTLGVTILYMAVNGVYLYALPLDQMAGQVNIAQVVAGKLLGEAGRLVVVAAILLAIAGCINATVMTGARICYAMGRDGVFFRSMGRVHPRFNTPVVALLVQGVISLIFVVTGNFEQLLSYVVFAMLLTSMATAGALFVLRFTRPGAQRPYKTWGYPVVPGVFILSYLWIAGSITLADPISSGIGLAMAATGVPFFWFWRRIAGP